MGDEDTDRPPETVPDAPSLDLSFGDFERVERIGGSGAADVFRARVPEHDLDVAVKQPQSTVTVDRSVAVEFVREAETWARLDDHRAVVSVLGWGAGDDPETAVPWMAMEYMDGGNLRQYLGSVGPRRGLWIGREVTAAVWHAHRQGRTHYDLKPANVLFRRTADGWDAPKVADWELSRALIERSPGVEGLTPRYAAPEQLRPERFDDPDERTDIYQLGTLVYELLTGEHPFGGGDPTALARAVLEDDPRRPTAVAPSLPARIDEVLLPALERDPGDRYEASLDLRRSLTEILESLDGADTATAAGSGAASGVASGTTDAAPPSQGAADAAGGSATSSTDDAPDDSGRPPDPSVVHEDEAAYRATAAGTLTELLNEVERREPRTTLARIAADRGADDGVPEPVLRDGVYPRLFETVETAATRLYRDSGSSDGGADSGGS